MPAKTSEARRLVARRAALARHHPGSDFPEIDEQLFTERVRQAVDQLGPISAETAERVAQILRSAVRRDSRTPESAAS